MVKNFNDDFNENITKLAEKQEKNIIDLFELRKKYVRLAGRIGYRPEVIDAVFEKERKKTIRKLRKKNYGNKLKLYAEKDQM